MKLYQLILIVPDDFNPDEMELKVECGKPVNLASEGFIGPEKIVECNPDVEIPQQAADAGLFGSFMNGIADGVSSFVSDTIPDVEVKEVASVAVEHEDSEDSDEDKIKEDAE